MHQAIGQFAVGSKQQQTGRVDIEPADPDPARAAHAWQLFVDRRPSIGIVVGTDLADRFVIGQVALAALLADPHRFTVDVDDFAALQRLTDLRWLTVYGDPAGAYPLLDLTP